MPHHVPVADSPARLVAADFAIEHRRMRPDGMRDLLGQLRPLLEDVVVARDQPQRCPRTCANAWNPSSFGSKKKSGRPNGSEYAKEPHGVTGDNLRTCRMLTTLAAW
jgi:hypothetical protein